MAIIESIDDQMRGVVTYELPNGQRLCFDAKTAREYGIATLVREAGYGEALPTERVPVMQYDREIGTVPSDFEPMLIKSRSFLYEPRRSDFTLKDGRWIAAKTLGPGDLEAVPGFVWSPSTPPIE